MLPGNDKCRAGQHRNDVHDEEQVCEAGWDCQEPGSAVSRWGVSAIFREAYCVGRSLDTTVDLSIE